MTKVQLKEKYTEWNKNISALKHGKEPKRQGATATSRQDRSATCFLTRASQ